MRKVLITLGILLLFASSRSQSITAFPLEHDKFIKELDQYVTTGKLEASVKTFEEFQKMTKDGKISSTWIDEIIVTANLMIGRTMAPYPHFFNYLNAIISASKSSKTDQQFQAWNDLLDNIIKNQKKGDNNDFLKFVEFSNVFFQQNALSVTAAKTWKVETSDYKFGYEDNKPSVSFPTTTLLGYVKGDTISIKQTAGDYYPLETRWSGKSGKVDWARANFDPNKVYCTFKNYNINLSNFNYTVDTVTFYHTDYFKQALKGKLQDKMVSSSDTINMTYPRFESYDAGMTIKDIAPNVSYTGGFSLHGPRVLGSAANDEKATLSFYARDGKTKILSARAHALTIKKGVELGAEKAEVSIYFGTDSIYHPQLNLVYKIPKREMRLLRGETGLSQAKFTDSYHNDEFQTDAIFWNLDSSILNLKILSGVGKKPGVYESTNYFNKELLRKTQGLSSIEPLSLLKRMCEKYSSRDINATDFARALDPNLKEGEVKSLLYDLVASGFILYNEELGVITVREKTINYVLAKAKKIDYDIITIKSAPQSGNDYIDLKSSDIDLKGVFEVPISDTAYVYFRPRANSISLQKDRNMEFDGLIYAGRMDLIGEKHIFNYAPFNVELTKVDTLRINVPDSNKVDKNGQPILKALKSRVEDVKGLLEIDAPINKSGRTRLPQFPRLYSREKSHIYYDDPNIAKGAYTRKNFFFELDPFRIDSLQTFDPDIINWKGTLVSGGIFPDVKDSVHIQHDESLGFKSETPEKGFDLYKGKGKYYGKYELNYSGLQGDGRITHSTADFTTHDARLYPDSMRATTDTFLLAKTFEGVKTPSVTGTSDMVFWKPLSDSMYISMNDKDKPFAMYDDSFTTFKGKLLLTDKGLKGNGTLDWDQATLSSKDISFKTMDLSADTASLNIKTTGDRVSFKTPNVQAKVDFKTRIGDFKSNQRNIPTEFSYNQYTTAINEFKWFMDEKILDFKAPPQGQGEYFTSTRPDQKGLKFLGKRATYNLITSLLRIEQVPEIKVADASVVPDSGVVIIEGEAKMHQFRNAVIYADTIHKYHKFENAVVDIYSKEALKAIGDYTYITKDAKEVINFGDIGTKKESDGEKKGKHDIFKLVAKANIDEKQDFVLYPGAKFNGEASIISTEPLLNFKGFAKVDLKNPKAVTSEFFINQEVDPKNLGLKFDEGAKSSTGNHLIAGIHISPVPDAAVMYTTLLAPKHEGKDITIFKATGIVGQSSNGEYVFGNEKKIRENALSGNILRYDDKKGTVKADGKFDLGTNFGIIRAVAAGTADVKLDTGKYKFNLTLGIDANMGDKVEERVEFHMGGDNSDQADVSYENEKQKKVIYELSDAQDDKRMLSDFEKIPTFTKRPKELDHNFVFTDVNFVFDPDDVSLRSVGKIGVAMIGKKVINKKLEGYIEIQYKGGVDVFTIYLQTGTKDWFYFEYRPGTLGIISSYDDVNKQITALTPDKRRIYGENKRFYLYSLGSSGSKSDFIDYMKDKAAGINRPHPEPKFEEPVMIPVTDTFSETPSPRDSVGLQREKIQQQEINQLEQMKMSGGSILSGPPPDRLKKKAEPVVDTVPQKEDKERMKQQQEINELEKMKEGGGSILSGPPPGRNKPKADTIQPKGDVKPEEPAVPKQEVPVPQPEVPKQETPKPDTVQPKMEMKQEAPKQDAVPVQPEPTVPKQETPVIQPETPKPEVPKPDSVQPKTEIKQDVPKPEVVPVQTEPVVPKQEAPVTQPEPSKPSVPQADTVQPKSEIKQEAPKQEAVPAQTVPVVPKQEVPVIQAETPKPQAPNTDTVQTKSEIKQETPQQQLVPVQPEQQAPKQDVPVVQQEVSRPVAPKADSVRTIPAINQPVLNKQDSVPNTVPK